MKKNQPLNEKEKKELETLDNPNVKFMSPPTIMSIMIKFFSAKRKRKKKVVNLRTRIKVNELGIDPNKNHQEYYKIVKEEEKRFDERFKNVE